MPIRVPNTLPAIEILQKENIFVMDEARAITQDIRELKIVIMNLMPKKKETEVQLIRLLSNTPLQIELTLLSPKSHESKNTSREYLETFYTTFEQIKHKRYDGMIITGAPVEQMPFEEVNYWDELKEIMEWTNTNVTSTFHICWGAQAGLYYHYNIPKYSLSEKRFGIYEHHAVNIEKLLQGLDDIVYIPHSRHSEVRLNDIEKCDELKILLTSEEAGPTLMCSRDGKHIFITGHAEYEARTLEEEYLRDLQKGLPIKMPVNYFRNDCREDGINVCWRSHANVIFSNWLNYYVYQVTPFNLE
ncbi:homoserine O-acetyltransferase MetA [Cellulosilyticum ruminicola]|uniref:homoserine O-acetyltransferase MetA n=1 Tax=Cellulosilyticum ruminicola TaxID=425254 RepID=UPI0006D052C5|nr:homoserine O-succinyltransferase [Cellulosilyticum ruminicola]